MAFFIFLLGAVVAVCSAQDTTTVPPMCNLDNERDVQLNEHWISRENEMDEDENGKKIMLDGDKIIELNQCHKDSMSIPVRGPLVSEKMFDACKLQEICKLADGSLYELIQDIDGSDCFSKLDTTVYPWGWGWEKENLYSSVAATGIPEGTTLMVNELINAQLPNATRRHNGCVRVVDTFVHRDYIGDLCDITLNVGYYSFKDAFTWPDRVTITEARCQVLKYD